MNKDTKKFMTLLFATIIPFFIMFASFGVVDIFTPSGILMGIGISAVGMILYSFAASALGAKKYMK